MSMQTSPVFCKSIFMKDKAELSMHQRYTVQKHEPLRMQPETQHVKDLSYFNMP